MSAMGTVIIINRTVKIDNVFATSTNCQVKNIIYSKINAIIDENV